MLELNLDRGTNATVTAAVTTAAAASTGATGNKIGSLEEIEMNPLLHSEELKLKIVNYSDLIYNQTENFTYAVVNLSKKELFITHPSNNVHLHRQLQLQAAALPYS